MDERYIIPTTAWKKISLAKQLGQPIYIYGATGFGKTEMVKQFLEKKKYSYISCANLKWDKEITDLIDEKIVVLDDMHLLTSEERREQVFKVLSNDKHWLIMICRSMVPSWLMSQFIKKPFIIVSEDELKLHSQDTKKYAEKNGIKIDEKSIRYICEESDGNPQVILNALELLKNGETLNEEFINIQFERFAAHIINTVIPDWDKDLVDFLMKISVVEEFDVGLAEMLTGNIQSAKLINKALETGNFIDSNDGVYTLRPVLLEALRKMALVEMGTERIKNIAYNAGLYYEMKGELLSAFRMFEKSENKEQIKDLLVTNARLNPREGCYYEFKDYYFNLTEEEVGDDPVLMAAISMEYSLFMNADMSEYWYDKLKEYSEKAHGGSKREAISRLAYLDIALPHRGIKDTINILKSIPIRLFDKNISLPEFSVTSNIPSVMNGGLDFCKWSKQDKLLAKTIGPIIEKVLGKHGAGIKSIAVGESQFEKGADDFEVMEYISRASLEYESVDAIDMIFISIYIQIRLELMHGRMTNALNILDSFEKKVKEKGEKNLLPTIDAIRCRISLYSGNQKYVDEWLTRAPDENKEFFILERFRYLTKIRCYISKQKYANAISLIDKVKYYAKAYERNYIFIECHILSAICKYSLNKEWKNDLLTALKLANEYQFVRIFSEFGNIIIPLLEEIKKQVQDEKEIDDLYFGKICRETTYVANANPVHSNSGINMNIKLTEKGLTVLRLQANGYSQSEIANSMAVSVDNVKYHIKQNYKKLGAANKTEAVLIARTLGLL